MNIKTCPFCGLPGLIKRYRVQTQIVCEQYPYNCGGATRWHFNLEEAMAEWEKRAQADSQAPVALFDIEKLAHEVSTESLAGSGVNFYMVAEMAIERTLEEVAKHSIPIAEICRDADGFIHIEAIVEDLDDFPTGMKLYVPQPTIAPSVAQVKAVALRVSYGGRISDDPILINDASPMSEKYWKDQGCIVEQLGVIAPSVAHRGGDLEKIARMLEGYAESYEMMARMEPDNQVRCSSVAYDIRNNMAKWVRKLAAPESTGDVAAGEKS